jgi:hypothetical protein
MKKFLWFALMASFVMTAAAQITEGAPSAKKYATGNRPLKGTYGLYFGVESELFDKLPGKFNVLPIVNLKYMVTDNFEARLGMKFWKQRYSFSGTNDADDDAGIVDETQKMKYVNAENEFRPGFAYHFTKSNLLDVYAGVEGVIGWRRSQVNISKWTFDGESGYNKARNASVTLGAGAFIGLQAFIARLPLAIGFEYGISAKWDGGLKTRTATKPDNDTDETVTYTVDAATNDPAWNAWATAGPATLGQKTGVFDHMKARKGAWGNQIRFTLSYYFNR